MTPIFKKYAFGVEFCPEYLEDALWNKCVNSEKELEEVVGMTVGDFRNRATEEQCMDIIYLSLVSSSFFNPFSGQIQEIASERLADFGWLKDAERYAWCKIEDGKIVDIFHTTIELEWNKHMERFKRIIKEMNGCKMTLILSDETKKQLDLLASYYNGDKSKVFKSAFALLEVAIKCQKAGGRIEFINDAKKKREEVGKLVEL